MHGSDQGAALLHRLMSQEAGRRDPAADAFTVEVRYRRGAELFRFLLALHLCRLLYH